jgi:ubiquinone/menaquinone biosynthesis C-methylase UbiE
MTGPSGHVIGVDMTASMLDRAHASAREMGVDRLELHESLIEDLPLEDRSVDVVISNGVIDLVPDMVIHRAVSEDARARRDAVSRPARRRPAPLPTPACVSPARGGYAAVMA